MDAEFRICGLYVVLDRVAGEIEDVRYLLDSRILEIQLHHPVLGLAQSGIEPGHTDSALELTFAPQRTFHLLEMEDTVICHCLLYTSPSPRDA